MDSGNIESGTENLKSGGALAPLSVPIFRRIWSASLISNFGHLMLGVAAAWEMTRLTDSKEMVALVQSALMLPLMLVSLPAGAVADMFDRRRIAMTGLGFSIFSAAILTALSLSGMLTPWLLLLFCVLIGGGVALYNPSWQASISEQVGPDKLPAAIALGTISYNIARSIGPALGGLLIVAAGAQAAFAINTLFYLPLLLAFLFWKKVHVPSRLPPERIDRAIVTGARYAMHSPPVRNILLRAAAFAGAGAAAAGLSPLVARDLLGGNAGSFGLLMGAGGVGAVGGAMLVVAGAGSYFTRAGGSHFRAGNGGLARYHRFQHLVAAILPCHGDQQRGQYAIHRHAQCQHPDRCSPLGDGAGAVAVFGCADRRDCDWRMVLGLGCGRMGRGHCLLRLGRRRCRHTATRPAVPAAPCG